MRKEFQRLKTDRRTMFLIFVIPVILIVIFGLSSGGGPQKFFTVVVISEDEMFADGYYEADQIATYDELFVEVVQHNCSTFTLYQDIYYNVTSLERKYDAYNSSLNLLRNDRIDAIIILPANFSELVNNKTSPIIEVIADGSDLNVLDGLKMALAEPIGMFKLRSQTFENFTIAMPHFEYDVPFYKAQVLNYAIPIVLPMMIVGLDMNLCSLCIVSEEALPRLILTPSGKKDLLFAKLLSYSLVMVIQVLEIFLLIQFFGFYCYGQLFLFFIALLLCGLVGISMGLAISSVARTSQQANQMFIVVFIMVVLFSNAFLKLDLMPPFMMRIANLFPMAYAIPMIQDVMFRGIGINPGPIIVLIIFYLVVAYLGFGLKRTEV